MRLLTCTDKHDMVSSSVFVTQHCSSLVDTGNPSRILDCLHIPEKYGTYGMYLQVPS